MPDVSLGPILLSQGFVNDAQIEEATRLAEDGQFDLGQALLRLGHIDDEQLARGLARKASMPFVDLSKGRIAEDVLDLIPQDKAIELNIIPIKAKGNTVIVAMADPMAAYNLEELRFLLNLEFKCALASASAMREAFVRYYQVEKEGVEAQAGPKKVGHEADVDEAPIIRLVDSIITDAVKAKASDIHIEPYEEELRVRYRVDGVCETVSRHPKHLQSPVISRIKILAGLDISEKRKPQDGRIMTRAGSKEIDMRVSTLPAINGESVVCRILDKVEGLVSLSRLGFSGEDSDRFQRIIKRPNGIFLVTGPTGSGKTTTLYAALKELNRPDVKIITAENPVEYHLKGINQVQVKHSIGLDFARILRSMLRQAPNIILVGEIRDEETASIAIQAALTGHLVFSTLHTNDAPSAVTRLIDMGVKPFLVSTSLVAALAQRLLRVLCNHCKAPYQPTAPELMTIGLSEEQAAGSQIYAPVGCKHCAHNGYSGRIAIFELMEMDNALREATFNDASHLDLRRQAVSGGMSPLRADGARKVLEGVTSIEEVLRVVSQEVGE